MPPCFAYKQSKGMLVSNTDGFTPFETYGLLSGWIWPTWLDNQTLLRSDPAGILNDDAVINQLGGPVDPWFYDHNQGLGVISMELSRDLTNVIGIAGFSDEKLRVYRTTMSPFGAPDWDHTPFTNKVNVPTAQQCWELTGAKYLSTSMAPTGKAFAYGTADGVYTTAIPDNCAPGGPGTWSCRARSHPTGVPPTSRPRRPRSPLSRRSPPDRARASPSSSSPSARAAWRATLTTGAAGRAT